MNWLIARLKEASTWRGIVWMLTACGVTLRPEVWEQITAVGMAAAGLLGVLTREAPRTVKIELPPIELVGRSDSPQQLRQPADSAERHPAADRAASAAAPVPHDGVQARLDPQPQRTANPAGWNEPPGWNG